MDRGTRVAFIVVFALRRFLIFASVPCLFAGDEHRTVSSWLLWSFVSAYGSCVIQVFRACERRRIPPQPDAELPHCCVSTLMPPSCSLWPMLLRMSCPAPIVSCGCGHIDCAHAAGCSRSRRAWCPSLPTTKAPCAPTTWAASSGVGPWGRTSSCCMGLRWARWCSHGASFSCCHQRLMTAVITSVWFLDVQAAHLWPVRLHLAASDAQLAAQCRCPVSR